MLGEDTGLLVERRDLPKTKFTFASFSSIAVAASAGTLKTKPGGAVWDEETAVSVLPWKQGRWGGGVGVTVKESRRPYRFRSPRQHPLRNAPPP